MVELEDLVKRRDYRLKYSWGCTICYPKKMWDWTTIFLYRTDEEFERGESYIKQVCLNGHVTKPMRFCTKCGETYTDTNIRICPTCEPHVIKVAEIEVQIEEKHREKNRLKSHLKKHKIEKDQYYLSIENLDYSIDSLRNELTELGE